MDNQNYEIVSHNIGNNEQGVSMLCLTQVGKKSFIEELSSNKRTREKASKIIRTIKRVLTTGSEWAWVSQTYKVIQGTGVKDIVVLETRVKGSVIRVATYLCTDNTPIFLFDFESHAGSDSGIPSDIKDRAVKLARIARTITESDLKEK